MSTHLCVKVQKAAKSVLRRREQKKKAAPVSTPAQPHFIINYGNL